MRNFERGIKRQEMNVSFTRMLKIRLNQNLESINNKITGNVQSINNKIDQKLDPAKEWIAKKYGSTKEWIGQQGKKAKKRLRGDHGDHSEEDANSPVYSDNEDEFNVKIDQSM